MQNIPELRDYDLEHWWQNIYTKKDCFITPWKKALSEPSVIALRKESVSLIKHVQKIQVVKNSEFVKHMFVMYVIVFC